MKIQELKYNLYLIDFKQTELEIQNQIKKELERYGVMAFDAIPRKDYLQLIRYFTLSTLCKHYNTLPHKKNTIFYILEQNTDKDILKFVKDLKKYFPFPLYITDEYYDTSDNASTTEITLKLKEFRYSSDFSSLSYNKIRKFCKDNNLESLTLDFKL